jgi:hypothetical protein
VSVPVRAVAFGFPPTLNVTPPLPLPLDVPVSVIQLSLLSADHGQPPGAVTVVEPVPPAAAIDWLPGEME